MNTFQQIRLLLLLLFCYLLFHLFEFGFTIMALHDSLVYVKYIYTKKNQELPEAGHQQITQLRNQQKIINATYVAASQKHD